MIGKVIKRKSSSSKSIAANVKALTTYVHAATGDMASPGEKVLATGSHGFICEDFKSQVTEMISLAVEGCQGTSSKNPIKHYLLSWKEHEKPNAEDAKKAVEIFLKELRLSNCQYQWALHDDTNNLHVHIVVNRIDLESEMILDPGGGFEKESIHRAIARMEKAGNWSQEKNARYDIDAEGRCVKRVKVNPDEPKPPSKAQDMETRTGEKSQIRVGIENAGPLISAATSWKELHASLEKIGMRYERNGGGAVIWTGGEFVKASTVVKRSDSFDKLQKKFGPFEEKGIENEFVTHEIEPEEPDSDPFGYQPGNVLQRLSARNLATAGGEKSSGARVLQIDARFGRRVAGALRREADSGGDAGEPLGKSGSTHFKYPSSNTDGRAGDRLDDKTGNGARDRKSGRREPLNKGFAKPWAAYAAQRNEHFSAKQAAAATLTADISARRTGLRQAQKAEKAKVLGGDWTGKGLELKALKSILAARQAGARANLQDKVAVMRSEQAIKHAGGFPDFESWLKATEGDDQARAWRERNKAPVYRDGDGDEDRFEAPDRRMFVMPKPKTDIRDFSHEVVGGHVHYLNMEGVRSFTDVGKSIHVHSKDDASMLAALQLAAVKFGGEVHISGGEKFQAQTVRIAVQNGIKISNPELAQLVKDETEMHETAKRAVRNVQAAEAQRAAAVGLAGRLKASADARAKAQAAPAQAPVQAPVPDAQRSAAVDTATRLKASAGAQVEQPDVGEQGTNFERDRG